jgi:hypothetical protein
MWLDNFFSKYIEMNSCQNPNPFRQLPNGSIEFNLSKKDEYYTQRNNKMHPYSSCNTTSLVNGLLSSNIPFKVKEGIQPEDYLTSVLESGEAIKIAMDLFPYLIDTKTKKLKTEPRLIAKMLAWCAYKVISKKVAVYTAGGNVQDMIWNMVKEKGTTIGLGSFTSSGHYVNFVGFCTTQDSIRNIKNPEEILLNQIKYLIFDDPWGNYYKHYEDANGNDLHMPIKDFYEIIWGGKDNKSLIYIRKRGFKTEDYHIKDYIF